MSVGPDRQAGDDERDRTGRIMAQHLRYELPEYLARRREARRRDRYVQLGALFLAVAALVGASRFVEPMKRIRIDSQLVSDPSNFRDLPPLETLLAKTGTFRALAIDIAFIRLERLKEEGKYYELKQLAEWICTLAPQFPSVWAYQAWNQAYNISVATYTPELRWKWVNNGISTLRDHGIVLNPKSVTLYKELAWIYWHKIGDFMDDHHWDYKKELAIEMERVLGAPPPVVRTEDVLAEFKRIVDAPELEVLLTDDAEVARLVDQLEDLGLRPDFVLLDFVAQHLRDDLSVQRLLEAQPKDEEPSLFVQRVALLANPEYAGPRDRLLAALRAKVLLEEHQLDPDWMYELMQRYGPIDWRSPYAMALYWASWGDIQTRGQLNLNPHDSMNTVRFIFFALDNMIKRGKMMLVPNFEQPNQSTLELLPDPRFIPHYRSTVIGLSRDQFPNSPEVARGEPAGNYRVGYFNMMAYGVQQLWFEGDPESLRLAERYYTELREWNRNHDGTVKKQFLVPLREYALKDLKEAAAGFKTANMLINGLLHRSIREAAAGNAEHSSYVVQQAREVYREYMSDKWEDRNVRRRLGNLDVLYADAVESYVRNPAFPLLDKVRAWVALPGRVRQIVWDALEPVFHDLCARHEPPMDVVRAFPQPPGMDEYRRNPVQRDQGSQPGPVSAGSGQ